MDIWRLLLYLLIGTVAMLIPIMIQGTWYKIKYSNQVKITILLTIAGTLGTFLMFYIENGRLGGISFFGAVFFTPILFIPIAHILKIRFDFLMDLCAPAECVMLAIMKMQCYLTGCCGGRLVTISNYKFVFPSQLAELANALILCVVLMLLARRDKHRGLIYPLYMILYGISRFILNIFRQAKVMGLIYMPFGNFWAICCVFIGLLWIFVKGSTMFKRKVSKDV